MSQATATALYRSNTERILAFLSTGPSTARELHTLMPEIVLGTIYACLRQMDEQGLVRKIGEKVNARDPLQYELTARGHKHAVKLVPPPAELPAAEAPVKTVTRRLRQVISIPGDGAPRTPHAPIMRLEGEGGTDGFRLKLEELSLLTNTRQKLESELASVIQQQYGCVQWLAAALPTLSAPPPAMTPVVPVIALTSAPITLPAEEPALVEPEPEPEPMPPPPRVQVEEATPPTDVCDAATVEADRKAWELVNRRAHGMDASRGLNGRQSLV